ncbi:hypothetical protein B0T14DRAFT_126323 [Immersiella caudata]|uniref:Uncharacterized protein n=1 Tax=Immersiella caudata TaxID=314043 RepID=A0AA39X510_9PEZI|nr:hypothetical protein B0T14DRAFT_126323 [Immersiella caudata]
MSPDKTVLVIWMSFLGNGYISLIKRLNLPRSTMLQSSKPKRRRSNSELNSLRISIIAVATIIYIW